MFSWRSLTLRGQDDSEWSYSCLAGGGISEEAMTELECMVLRKGLPRKLHVQKPGGRAKPSMAKHHQEGSN